MRNKILFLLSLLILSVIVCSCGGSNSADQAAAESYALSAADQYYYSFLDGAAFNGGKVTGHETSISNVEYSSGQYMVTVDLALKGTLNEYKGMPVNYTQKIVYTLEVKDGEVEQIDVDYQR